MKYSVIENTPGYLPESEPADFENEHDAYAHACDLVEQLKEQGYEIVSEVIDPKYGDGEILLFGGPNDLGRVIEINRWPNR